MRTTIFALGVFGIAMLSAAGGVQPGEAMVIYPWCAQYGGRNGGGAASCGSTTLAQCLATVSGMQGFCDRNPWYVDPPAAVAKRAKRSTRG
jgi:hypothetical protein